MSEHSNGLVAHHFEDLEQQQDATLLGMWIFLITELMLFGGLFGGYAVYRYMYPEMFEVMSGHLNLWLGTINTFVLLTSSFTMALAVHAARCRRRHHLVRFIQATIALGLLFLVFKAFEYYTEFEHHLVPMPGLPFQETGVLPADGKLFMGFYFAMTGVHALHMIIGISLLSVMAWLASKDRFTTGNPVPVEVAGLYWHLVDVIWIFIFPLLYLV